jgi:lipopolysaccharide export system protein LptC
LRRPRFKLPGKAWWIALRARGWRFAVAEAQVSFFPVVLAAVLAGMAYWLAVVSSPQDEDVSGRFRHDPDSIVGRFVLRSFGEQGLKKDVLNAEGAEHYPDDESTMMKKPNLVHQNSGNVPPTTVKSDQAFLNSDQSEVELVGNVVGFRPAFGDRQSVTFNTSQIMIYTDEERAETKHRVKVYQGRDWMAGTGFDMDNVLQVFNFHSHVEGIHYPGTKPVR